MALGSAPRACSFRRRPLQVRGKPSPILARLDLTVGAWPGALGEGGQMGNGCAGTPESRNAEARRRGVAWVRSRCHLFTRRVLAA